MTRFAAALVAESEAAEAAAGAAGRFARTAGGGGLATEATDDARPTAVGHDEVGFGSLFAGVEGSGPVAAGPCARARRAGSG